MAGPEIERAKEYQFTAKEKTTNKHHNQTKKHIHTHKTTTKKQNQFGQALLATKKKNCSLHTWAPTATPERYRNSPWACRRYVGCLGCSKRWQRLRQLSLQLAQKEKLQIW